jgi:hypothetical protein
MQNDRPTPSDLPNLAQSNNPSMSISVGMSHGF